MDLSLSDEEVMVVEAAAKVADAIGVSTNGKTPPLRDAWSQAAQAGLLSLRLTEPESRPSCTMVRIIVEAMGRRLCAIPYLGHILGTELLIRASADPAQLSSDAATGPTVIGLQPDLMDVAVSTSASVADTAEGARVVWLEPDGRTICTGKSSTSLRETVDLGRQSGLASSADGLIGYPTVINTSALSRWKAFSLCMVAADLVGVMDGALTLAVDHVNNREQFGVKVGTFQAVQHLLAEQAVLLAGARAAVNFASWAIDELSENESLLAARTGKAAASEAGKSLTEAVIQACGGMGFTWESNAHRFLRRALYDRVLLGDEKLQFARISDLRRLVRVAQVQE